MKKVQFFVSRFFEPAIYWLGFAVGAMFLLSATSCATMLGGNITEYQTTKPAPGEPQREIRVGALVADLFLFWPGAVIDFATGAIYKPYPGGYVSPSRAERKAVWEAKRARLLAERELIRIRKWETKNGMSYETMQKIDSLERIIRDNQLR